MRFLSRKVAIVIISLLLLGAAAGWWLLRRPSSVAMATYVPGSALGYIEVNDWPEYLNQVTSTPGWRKLAPVYQIHENISAIGELGWIARLTGDTEIAIAARSQVAIVVTGIEVRGNEVKPRMALLAETHTRSENLGEVVARRLPMLARRVFGRTVSETSEYHDIPVSTYRPAADGPNSGRKLHSAMIEGEWILANHEEALRSCIDTRLGRSPSMAGNFYLQNSRPIVDRDGQVFGFVTGDGVNRLLRFGAFLISNAALRETGIIEALEDVLSDLSSSASTGIAYGAEIEDGEVIDRYALLLKPDLVDSIRPVIKTIKTEPVALEFIPDTVREATFIRLENPNQTIDQLEAAISARIGVGQSFLLHQFLLGARDSLLGLDPEDESYKALGDEIVSLSFDDQPEERVWMIRINDRASMPEIAANYLRGKNASIKKETLAGYEMINSTDEGKGSATFIDQFIVLGKRERILKLLNARRDSGPLKESPRFNSVIDPATPSIMTSFYSVSGDADSMMSAISSWFGNPGKSSDPAGRDRMLKEFPLGSSLTNLSDQGIYIETHSAFGTLPFFITLINGVSDGK